MKKGLTYIIIIISVILFIGIINLIAWWDGTQRTVPFVAGFEGVFPLGPTVVPTPPCGPESEIDKWELVGVPTPPVFEGNPDWDLGSPGIKQGINSARVQWRQTYQSIQLDQQYFQNVGCVDPVSTPDTSTYDCTNPPTGANNWECYDFVRFFVYLNENVNGCDSWPLQSASLYDGRVTFTSFEIPIECQSASVGENYWRYHLTMSLNYMRNYYDESEGSYFSITNVAKFIINAPNTNYANWTGFSLSDPYLVMYYDYVTLGADIAPNTPAAVSSIDVTYNGVFPEGLEVNWSPSAGGGTNTITAYHVYRSQDNASSPYVSVDIISSTITSYIDTSMPDDDTTYCYKILAASGGPGVFANTGDLEHNTINATYHEALLEEAGAFCGYYPVVPTNTVTPTATPFGTPPTPMPTATPTPVDNNLDEIDARVYPNPFNPNQGSRKFYTDNIPQGSHVSIYAMDGSLVEDGEIQCSNCRFEWDGKNKNGSKVVSGLYYLVVEAPDDSSAETKVYRIIVCYKCDTTYDPNP